MMCENCFSLKVEIKDSVVLKFEMCEHRDDTYIVNGDCKKVKC